MLVMSKLEMPVVGFCVFPLIPRLVRVDVFISQCTYLTEVMSVECQCCLRPQLEEMKLCGENLLSSGHCGQIEPELHLFTAHCKGGYMVRHQHKHDLFPH